ncbi:MAG: class I tRNA ligase family protein, partial [Candidatus Aenigmarchaeota archaeon]|nr:class I tRNA ligase family protein [Candidatus Aenigmarchaeota archaeon]
MPAYDFAALEQAVAERWRVDDTYAKAKQARKGQQPFFFQDGPPYATGSIHMGTAWNKIMKDAYVRSLRMLGHDVRDQPGYDTHGTPIEVQVEKELGFANKKDIEKYGAGKFIAKCREFATRYIDVMNQQFMDLGVWLDWYHPYLTLDNRYIEGAWYTFQQAYRKGYLYTDRYSVHVCTRCETAVAYNEIEHVTAKDPAIYVKFKVKGKEEKLVVWTTTPWTLPGNTGIMA